MSIFKDLMAADVDLFLSLDEFGYIHKFGDKDVRAIIDSDTMNGQPLPYAEGVSLFRKIVYLDPIELGYVPQQGYTVKLDGVIHNIADVADEDGLLKITLEANVG